MRIVVLGLWALLFTNFSGAQPTEQWYKGNLHTHSYWSDGDDFPEMIMDWYQSNGYDFVALSDHNVLATGEFWKLMPDTEVGRQSFAQYRAKFGDDWVVYKENNDGRVEVKLKTLEEYRPRFEQEGEFLIIQAEEITDAFEGKPIHMNATNVQELIQPQGGQSVTEVMQNNLDQVYAQRKRTGQPMFPHLNHPNFGWAITVEDMQPLRGERFFEVYNGHPLVNNYGDSAHLGTEAMWDQLLIHYLQQGKPLLYGLATDDAHNYHTYNGEHSNPGRGWVMVRAAQLTPTALIEAMERGDFYASTGVTLEDVRLRDRLRDKTLSVRVVAEEGVTYRIQFWGAQLGESKAQLLKEVTGTQGAYALQEDDLYVRAKIISSQPQENPFAEGDTEVAWTQPVVPTTVSSQP